MRHHPSPALLPLQVLKSLLVEFGVSPKDNVSDALSETAKRHRTA